MAYDRGIRVAITGGSVDDSDSEIAYNSLKSRLIVDSRPGSGHLFLDPDMKGGSVKWSFPTKSRREEYLVRIEHGLDFIPRIQASFFVRDAPAAEIGYLNSFNGVLFRAAGFFQEYVAAGADREYVYIRRVAETFETTSFTYESIFQDFLITTKLMIFNNAHGEEPYEKTLELL